MASRSICQARRSQLRQIRNWRQRWCQVWNQCNKTGWWLCTDHKPSPLNFWTRPSLMQVQQSFMLVLYSGLKARQRACTGPRHCTCSVNSFKLRLLCSSKRERSWVEREVDAKLLLEDHLVKEPPGAKILADEFVEFVTSGVDESALTGESVPVLQK